MVFKLRIFVHLIAASGDVLGVPSRSAPAGY